MIQIAACFLFRGALCPENQSGHAAIPDVRNCRRIYTVKAIALCIEGILLQNVAMIPSGRLHGASI